MKKSKVIIVGGGAVGVGILYALARRGIADANLLERTELTAGSTWHAAGLIPIYSFSRTRAWMIKKSIEIFESLEEDTGQPVSWHKCGQLRIASTEARFDEYKAYMAHSVAQGVRAEILTPAEIKEKWPLMELLPRIKGAVYHPDDGHIAPADLVQAMAKGARSRGARIHRNTEVLSMRHDGHEWIVETSKGTFCAEHVVTATGNYARQTGKMVGLEVPAIPYLHQYLVTDEAPELVAYRSDGHAELPVLRDDHSLGYFREERGGFIFGPYEHSKDVEPFAVDGVPKDFGADLLPPDYDAIEEHVGRAMEIVPSFGRVGIKDCIRGPIVGAPDLAPLLGPAPGLKNYWLAEAFTGGILASGGAGELLAGWIFDGQAPIDMADFDPRRFGNFATKRWAVEKGIEHFGQLFGQNTPGHQWGAGRPQKTTPTYDLLRERGAVFGMSYGWEVPFWYADKPGVFEKGSFRFRDTNYFDVLADECRAAREDAAMFDMSHMSKFEVSGPGTTEWLDGLIANTLPRTSGRAKLCHLLTTQGTVRSEFTIAKLGEDHFYMVSSPRMERHDDCVLRELLPEGSAIHLRNVTLERGIITLMGPKSRDLLQPLTDQDLSNEAFSWMGCRSADIGYAGDVRMLRLNFIGELGYELHVPICYMRHLTEALLEAGKDHGIRLIGSRAYDCLRMEKSYRSIVKDINSETTLDMAGLDKFVGASKPAFIGRDMVLAERAAGGPAKRMITLRIDGGLALAGGGEGLTKNGKLVGVVTSGNWSYQFGTNLALALVDREQAAPDTELDVLLLNETCKAVVIEDSPHDPENTRLRGK